MLCSWREGRSVAYSYTGQWWCFWSPVLPVALVSRINWNTFLKQSLESGHAEQKAGGAGSWGVSGSPMCEVLSTLTSSFSIMDSL